MYGYKKTQKKHRKTQKNQISAELNILFQNNQVTQTMGWVGIVRNEHALKGKRKHTRGSKHLVHYQRFNI